MAGFYTSGGINVKKVVLIPDSFKGTLSSAQICEIIGGKVAEHFPGCQVVSIPVADGGPADASPLDPPALPEEMLLFKGFPDKALVRFLRAYREAGLEKIELKASLTPHNAAWDSLRLYTELCQERDALR